MQQNVLELKIYRNSCHQWVYKKMVNIPRKGFNRVVITRVVDKAGVFAGIGIFNPDSTVAIRFLTNNDESVDRAFFYKRLAGLKRLKENILGLAFNSDCYRLVHSESDGLPGLIIDKFNDYIMIKPYCAGYGGEIMEFIASSLSELYAGVKIMVVPDEKSCAKDGADYRAEMKKYYAGRARAEINEFGVKFAVDFEFGQKTGFFLDQRVNREKIGSLGRDAHVLNCFAYTAAFSVYCAEGGAKKVVSLDISKTACVAARKNLHLNWFSVENYPVIETDVFDYFRHTPENYNMIILDPPAFAKTKRDVPKAARGYKDINLQAIKHLSKGGMLATLSCSNFIEEDLFYKIVLGAARDAGAELQLLSRLDAGPDHPVAFGHPEGRYLKGLLLVKRN